MAPVSYPRALFMAALQAALSGVWIAAGELSPARRRLTRFGAAALVTGAGYAITQPSRSSDAPDSPPDAPATLRLIAPGSANALGIAAPNLTGSTDATRPAAVPSPAAGNRPEGTVDLTGADDHAPAASSTASSPETASSTSTANGTGPASSTGATSGTGADSHADTTGDTGTNGRATEPRGAEAAHGLLDASELLGIGDKIEIPYDKRKAAIGAAVVALSVGAMVGRRRLEKRWLAGLTRSGHPHPTRALAVRIAAVEFAVQLVLQFVEQRRPRR